jgi:hypothetical protein
MAYDRCAYFCADSDLIAREQERFRRLFIRKRPDQNFVCLYLSLPLPSSRVPRQLDKIMDRPVSVRGFESLC